MATSEGSVGKLGDGQPTERHEGFLGLWNIDILVSCGLGHVEDADDVVERGGYLMFDV